MGILSLERRIDVEVLDDRGALAVTAGALLAGERVRGMLRDVPQLFMSGAHVAIALQVGADRYETLCRVLDDAVVVAPGSRISLEVLRTKPADVSGIEAFDMIPLPTLSPPTPPFGVSSPPQAPISAGYDEDEPTGVVGSLKEMPVFEIVQTLAQSARDALVEVKPKGQGGGVIGLERGRVVYCKTDRLLGEPAFFELFTAARGAFRIRYGRHADEKNIARDTTFLLLEAARLLDESGKMSVPPPVSSGAGELCFPEEGVVEAADIGATLVDHILHPMPSAPAFASVPPLPASSSGPFMRFFDEAGVRTPPPLPLETQRFTSLQLQEIAELDDVDRVDTDRTIRERPTPS